MKALAQHRNTVRRSWKGSSSLALALGAQLAFLAVAGVVVVMTPPDRSEPEFEAGESVYLPQQEIDHRTAVAEFQQAAAQPRPTERIATSELVPDGLPEMAPLPDSEFDVMESSEFSGHDGRALLSDSGITGALAGLSDGTATASFFGIEDNAERIVIVVNTSASVINRARRRGVTIERIQEEMLGLIEDLPPSALFGIVQFSQGARSFQDHLIPATAANLETLGAWVPENLRGNPRAREGARFYGHEAGFAEAFALEPEVIFLVTDGQLNRREGSPGNYSYPEIPYPELLATLRGLQQETRRDVRINVVGFEMSAPDADNMRRLVREFGGRLQEF